MTVIRDVGGTGNVASALYVMWNPPVGTFNIVLSASSGSRGISGSSANFGNVSVVDVSGGGGGQTTSTDPFTTTATATARGIVVAGVHVMTNSSTLPVVSGTAPTGMTLAHTANRFTSNSFGKYQAIFYSPTLVSAGSVSVTMDVTTGSLGSRLQDFAILR